MVHSAKTVYIDSKQIFTYLLLLYIIIIIILLLFYFLDSLP